MTLESMLPQQALANVSLEDRVDDLLLRTPPSSRGRGGVYRGDVLYKPGGSPPLSFPTSLNRLMSARACFSSPAASASLPAPKKVSFFSSPSSSSSSAAEPAVDYGYGVAEPSSSFGERPAKRRRFERRNSKTPAMLLATMQAALELEGDDDTIEGAFPSPDAPCGSPREGRPAHSEDEEEDDEEEEEDDDDNWEGGLEIAQELVKQLQQRRRPGLFG